MSGPTPPTDDDEAQRSKGGYDYTDWRADGFRGRPPWRRGLRPGYLVLSLLLVALLLAIFVWAGSRLP
jgi:hypothetical protein